MARRAFHTLLFVLAFFHAISQRVDVHADKSVDVSTLRTFAVLSGDLVLVLPDEADGEALKKEIRNAIKERLEDKGYTHEPDTSKAALAVTFVAEVVERIEQQELGPLGQTPAARGTELDPDKTWTQRIRTGSFALEAIETRSRKTAWRSSSEMSFRSADLNEVVYAAVSRSLRKFPRAKK